ncbi:hypothetical protein HU200_035609 [Digitaria exilis]|uniref:Uncharacterized protein n=1 Tax=Digitaria exilis TaxID=1010633 RepID=A0A835EJ15_9POAL|nr:hypothetical protein HU200_035609 [Digitaria exilis]CAB3467177.1 unnamed protein product [Digitaria exilis]
MSTTAIRFLVLTLSGLLLVTIPSLCAGTAAHVQEKCQPSGTVQGPRLGYPCEGCCKPGHFYLTYQCSPPVTNHTKAIMKLNEFTEGGDLGLYCDGRFHLNRELVVILSTGWYGNGKRCGRLIRIEANGSSVLAKVVDECDTVHGCDRMHDYQPPCRPDVVGASKGVWDALGIHDPEEIVGEYHVSWSDA